MALLFWSSAGHPRRDAMEGPQSPPGPKFFPLYPFFTCAPARQVFFSSGSWRRKKVLQHREGQRTVGQFQDVVFQLEHVPPARTNHRTHTTGQFHGSGPTHSTRTRGHIGNVYNSGYERVPSAAEASAVRALPWVRDSDAENKHLHRS